MRTSSRHSESTVVVGLSGGVDSSIAAMLLKQQGLDVHAVYMQNWQQDPDDEHCPAEQDLKDARAVAEALNIPFSSVSFADTYWDKVFQYFLDEYAAGRTPNPDILCNKEIKFKAFLNHAKQLGADYIATGHYAQTHLKDKSWQLLKGQDPNKDQSYFLYTLGQHELEHALFPIGHLEKPAVRKMAKQAQLITSQKKDSTGICFIGERKFKTFLNEYLLAKPGPIQNDNGLTIGEHDGLMFYTLGQRQGLGIGGRQDANEQPWYVLDKDIEHNALIVGQGHDHPTLYSNALYCDQLHWVARQPPRFPLSCTAKTRYRQTDQPCEVIPAAKNSDSLLVRFQTPQWAVTPGQSVVFYQHNICLGGGIITRRTNHD